METNYPKQNTKRGVELLEMLKGKSVELGQNKAGKWVLVVSGTPIAVSEKAAECLKVKNLEDLQYFEMQVPDKKDPSSLVWVPVICMAGHLSNHITLTF